MWTIYILISKNNRHTYLGISKDIERRLKEHNWGIVKATKYGKPWKIIYEENVEDYRFARKREKYYKSSAGRRKIKQIIRQVRPVRHDNIDETSSVR